LKSIQALLDLNEFLVYLFGLLGILPEFGVLQFFFQLGNSFFPSREVKETPAFP